MFDSEAVRPTEGGAVIAFAGLSGIGKSTLASELARQISGVSLLEGEENDWPVVSRNRTLYGAFTMWMGFRQMWLPLQYEAQAHKAAGRIAILDSFFIKILHYEIGRPGMEWLIDPQDPYYNVFQKICELDVQHIPDPDCVLLLDVDYSTWKKLLQTRNRDWDKTPGFVETFEQTRRCIETATLTLCTDRGIKLVRFAQEFGDISSVAGRMRQQLATCGILPTFLASGLMFTPNS